MGRLGHEGGWSAVTFRSCTRHATNGLTVPAGPSGLCDRCYRQATAPKWRPVEVPAPVVRTPEQKRLREQSVAAAKAGRAAMRDRQTSLYLAARDAGLGPDEAAALLGVQPETARRRYEPSWLATVRESAGVVS